jgi:hypothetical protein
VGPSHAGPVTDARSIIETPTGVLATAQRDAARHVVRRGSDGRFIMLKRMKRRPRARWDDSELDGRTDSARCPREAANRAGSTHQLPSRSARSSRSVTASFCEPADR